MNFKMLWITINSYDTEPILITVPLLYLVIIYLL